MRAIWSSLLMSAALTLNAADDIRIVTLDPGHFHAALLQKEMLPGMAGRVHVYAPLGPDLSAHLNRIAGFNNRKERPTTWTMSIYAGPDFLTRMLTEKTGNVVVLSGRNQGKIDRVRAVIDAGMHAMVDKPWIIEHEDLPKLAAALEEADRKGVIAYDGMTQRFEISSLLQKEFVNDRAVFGEPEKGSPEKPGVSMESVHYLLKEVAGVPNLRPVWFFDIKEQGEGLADVGTHLVDLVQWTLASEQMLDYRKDIQVLSGKRWPTVLTPEQFRRVTGQPREDALSYYCNNSVTYTLKGVHVKLDVKWDFQAAPGTGDSELAIYRGTRADVEVRQGAEEKFIPEVYIVPHRAEVEAAVRKKIEALQTAYPGVAVERQGDKLHIITPEKFRVGHEAHFALLADRFLSYVRQPRALPSWEKAFMLAKYYVTTKGVALARP